MISRGRLGVRSVAVALIAVVLAILAARSALIFAFQDAAPDFVLKLDADNPIASVHSAQARATAGDDAMTSASLEAVARESIRHLPLNAAAFRLLAPVADGRIALDDLGDRMAVAHRLTRRDLGTELFLIEDAVRRNDIASALEAYDAALRIGQSSRELLYPVLTEALREPLVRRRFAPYVRTPPPWLESFLRFAVSNSSDPTSMVDLAAIAGGFPEGRAYASLDTELLTVLVARDELDTAARYYRSLENTSPGVLTRLATDPSTIDGVFAPVTWQPYSIEGIDAVWIATGAQLELEAMVDAGYTGPVARKLVALPPGRYRLSAPFRAELRDGSNTISWSMVCKGGKKLLAASAPLREAGSVEAVFEVTRACPVQLVTVSIATAPGLSAALVTLESPTLVRGG